MKKNEGKLVMESRDEFRARGPKDGEPEYWKNPELEDIGQEILNQHHEHLREAEISYLLTSKPMSDAGKTLAGKARKVSGILHYYTEADFLIVIASEFWKESSIKERHALIDHELCHCSVEYDKEGGRKWILKGHDIEEFNAIIDRRGLWNGDLVRFGQAVARQMEMQFNTDAQKEQTQTGPSQGLS